MTDDRWTYGDLEGVPTMYLKGSADVAWKWVDGKWREASAPDVFTKAIVLGRDRFEKMFGKLPPPPPS